MPRTPSPIEDEPVRGEDVPEPYAPIEEAADAPAPIRSEDDAPAPIEDAPIKRRSKSRESLPIRHTVNAWWCPNDDTSMPVDPAYMTCPVCGFERPEFTD